MDYSKTEIVNVQMIQNLRTRNKYGTLMNLKPTPCVILLGFVRFNSLWMLIWMSC